MQYTIQVGTNNGEARPTYYLTELTDDGIRNACLPFSEQQVVEFMLQHVRKEKLEKMRKNNVYRKACLALTDALGKIEAIDYLRKVHDVPLMDAKNLVEFWVDERNNGCAGYK